MVEALGFGEEAIGVAAAGRIVEGLAASGVAIVVPHADVGAAAAVLWRLFAIVCKGRESVGNLLGSWLGAIWD